MRSEDLASKHKGRRNKEERLESVMAGTACRLLRDWRVIIPHASAQ